MENFSDDDFANAIHDRRAMLRLLRDFDKQDEAERKENGKNDNEDTLQYDSYLSHQSYYDDYKHVNYRFIDFGAVNGQPLVIEQDRTLGKGGFVWDAGVILADHFINEKDWYVGKSTSIIELGAGTGVTGLMIAKAIPSTEVLLTDLPRLMPVIEKNSAGTPNVSSSVLQWGENVSNTYDVILGADCVASIYDSSALVQTIYNLAHDTSRVCLTGKDRLEGNIDEFERMMRRLFINVEKRRPISRNKNPNIWVMVAQGKRRMQ